MARVMRLGGATNSRLLGGLSPERVVVPRAPTGAVAQCRTKQRCAAVSYVSADYAYLDPLNRPTLTSL